MRIALTHTSPAEPYLDPDTVACLLARLSCIAGQVHGLGRMLSARESCEAILLQTASARAALEGATGKLLESHIQMCLGVYAASGNIEALRRLSRALELVLRN